MIGFDLSTATDIRLGSSQVELYWGSTKIWPSAPVPVLNLHFKVQNKEVSDNVYVEFRNNVESNYRDYEYSLDDGTTWLSTVDLPTRTIQRYSTYQYYMLKVNSISSGSTIQISEFKLIDENSTEQSLSGYYATVNGYTNEDYTKLFDNNTSTKWCANINNNLPCYIMCQANSAFLLSQYSFTTANDTASSSGRNPVSIEIYGSNTYSTDPSASTWTKLVTNTNLGLPAANFYTKIYNAAPTYVTHDYAQLAPNATMKIRCIYNGSSYDKINTNYRIKVRKVANDNLALFEASGNILSLLQKNNFTFIPALDDSEFRYFFNGQKITSAANLDLPFTAVSQYGFANMFQGCTALTTPPALLALTLNDRAYFCMFKGCTALTTAPTTLPATTIGQYTYFETFQGCTALTTAPTTIAASDIPYAGCYHMFQDCSSLTTVPNLSAMTTVGEWGCTGMFERCTSLTTAPSLPATSLAVRAYSNMFSDDTALVNAPTELAATLIPSTSTYVYYQMFKGCTSLTTAPDITYTGELPSYSCYEMFKGCTSLNSVKCLGYASGGTYSVNCTTNWLDNVAATGTFTKRSGITWTTGTSGIPSGWTTVDFVAPNTITAVTQVTDGTIETTTYRQDTAHMYIMTQVRSSESPIYSTSVGSKVKRAASTVTPQSFVGKTLSDVSEYLITFMLVNQSLGTYHIRFANNTYIDTNLYVTDTYSSGNDFALYFTNGTTALAWNQDTDTGLRVDNDGPDRDILYYGSGKNTATSGNNIWTLYKLTFSPANS